MSLRKIVAFWLSIVHSFYCYSETKAGADPILEYFRMNPSHVSEHEIVKIALPDRLNKRDVQAGTPMFIQALGLDINLLLKPTDSVLASDQTPVYYARPSQNQNRPNFEKINGAMSQVGYLLQDPNHLASVVLSTNAHGQTAANGYLLSRRGNSPLVIRHLPESVVGGYLRKRRATNYLDNDVANSTYHLVARLNDIGSQNRSIDDIYRVGASRVARQSYTRAPNYGNANSGYDQTQRPTVYPQILVYIDASFQNDWMTRGLTSFLEYLLAFWNGVEMIYRSVHDPEFRFNIAAIVIATDSTATPYIATSMASANNFHILPALGRSARFFYDIQDVFPLDSFDIMFTLSRLYMVNDQGNYAFGYAYTNGACHVRHEVRENYGTALAFDSGAFAGVLMAAHETGHLFGSPHDDDPANGCVQTSNFLMAEFLPAGNNASWFSECSLTKFSNSYKNALYHCMYNMPTRTGNELARLMPGKVASLTEQCTGHGYGPQCYRVSPGYASRDVCAELACSRHNDSVCYYGGWGGAAPGSFCGSSQREVCMLSRCVTV